MLGPDGAPPSTTPADRVGESDLLEATTPSGPTPSTARSSRPTNAPGDVDPAQRRRPRRRSESVTEEQRATIERWWQPPPASTSRAATRSRHALPFDTTAVERRPSPPTEAAAAAARRGADLDDPHRRRSPSSLLIAMLLAYRSTRRARREVSTPIDIGAIRTAQLDTEPTAVAAEEAAPALDRRRPNTSASMRSTSSARSPTASPRRSPRSSRAGSPTRRPRRDATTPSRRRRTTPRHPAADGHSEIPPARPPDGRPEGGDRAAQAGSGSFAPGSCKLLGERRGDPGDRRDRPAPSPCGARMPTASLLEFATYGQGERHTRDRWCRAGPRAARGVDRLGARPRDPRATSRCRWPSAPFEFLRKTDATPGAQLPVGRAPPDGRARARPHAARAVLDRARRPRRGRPARRVDPHRQARTDVTGGDRPDGERSSSGGSARRCTTSASRQPRRRRADPDRHPEPLGPRHRTLDLRGTREASRRELAEEVRSRMFVFEDIVRSTTGSIQLILRQVDSKELATALKGVRTGGQGEDLAEHVRARRAEPRTTRSRCSARSG